MNKLQGFSGFDWNQRFLHVAFEDSETPLVVDEVEFFAYVLAFAINVDPVVGVAVYPDIVGFKHLDVLAEFKMVGIDERASDGDVLYGDFVDDADVDKSVVEFGLGCYGGIVAKLVAIGEGGEPCLATYFFAIDD